MRVRSAQSLDFVFKVEMTILMLTITRLVDNRVLFVNMSSSQESTPSATCRSIVSIGPDGINIVAPALKSDETQRHTEGMIIVSI